MTEHEDPGRGRPDRGRPDRGRPDLGQPDRGYLDGGQLADDSVPPQDDLAGEDAALLETLREVLLEVDRVPEYLLEAAKASFTWRTVDEELAVLVSDSALEDTAVRSGDAARVLTFTLGAATLILEIVRTGVLRRLIGQFVGDLGLPATSTPRKQVAPDEAEPARYLRLQRLEQETRLALDDLGHFVAEGIPAGPARFAFNLPGGRRAVTTWVTV